jgi:hypothetical protein
VPALEEALLVLDHIEDSRARLELDDFKMRFLADKIRHYERALALLMRTGRLDEGDRRQMLSASFHLVERARARSLLDLLAESRSRLRDGIEPALRDRESQVLDELSAGSLSLATAADPGSLAAARARVAQAKEDLERLEIEIRHNAPRYGEIAYPRPATLAEIQDGILGDNEVLLEYFVGDEHAWLWIVRRNGAELHTLAHPGEILAGVTGLLSAVESSGAGLGARSPGQEAADRLTRDILPPSPLPAGSRLIVVPDGPLHHIPFELLRRQGRFLIEDHEVVVVPSSSTLRLMRDQPVSVGGDGFLGIGDPVPAGGDERPSRLPHSRLEVETIARSFPESRRRVLLGEAATKATLYALELDRYRFIHFATHGWLDDADRRHSGLRLSALNGDAGAALLSPAEILTLELSAEVVVLSACQSGLGELLRGEGLVSLTRAFLYAGAQGVVVSLWNVGDQSTADFMQEFYGGLRAGHSASSALRQAKLRFLGSARPGRQWVRRWAPFILVGDPGYAERVLNRAERHPTE